MDQSEQEASHDLAHTTQPCAPSQLLPSFPSLSVRGKHLSGHSSYPDLETHSRRINSPASSELHNQRAVFRLSMYNGQFFHQQGKGEMDRKGAVRFYLSVFASDSSGPG